MQQELEKRTESTWFEEEVITLLPDLFSGARSMARSEADAEDLVAESVARAWERRDSLRERSRFRGWLFSIMRNCFISRHRKREARPTEVQLIVEGEDEEPSFSLFEQLHQPILLWWGNPEREFMNGLLKADIEKAVQTLSAEYRLVLVLADVRGLKYSEIADALEIPIGTVRSRLARARGCLQEELWSHAVEQGLREPKP